VKRLLKLFFAVVLSVLTVSGSFIIVGGSAHAMPQGTGDDGGGGGGGDRRW
jgi:hypothetical protein